MKELINWLTENGLAGVISLAMIITGVCSILSMVIAPHLPMNEEEAEEWDRWIEELR